MRPNDFTEETKREERRAKVGRYLGAVLILLVGGYFVATHWEKPSVTVVNVDEEPIVVDVVYDTVEPQITSEEMRKRSDQQRLETFSELMQLQELQDTILSSILMQKVEADIHVFVARQQMEQTSLDQNDSLRVLTNTFIHQLEMKLLQQLIEDTDIPVLVTGIKIEWAGDITPKNKK